MAEIRAPEFSHYVSHPYRIVITGDTRTGKSALGALLLEMYHNQGLACNLIAPPEVREPWPDWVGQVDPKKLDIKLNTVNLGDEMHLYAYARKWWTEPNRVLDEMGRLSGQMGCTFIYVTQSSKVLDINLVGQVDAIFFKYPALLQEQFERPQMRKMVGIVQGMYDDLIEQDLDPRKYVYVYSKRGEAMLGPYDAPTWYTDEISTAYKNYSAKQRRRARLLKLLQE